MTTQWRKSSHSGTTQGSDCVELATLGTKMAKTIGVRDSKAPEAGHLELSATVARGLARRIKAGELDL